MPSDHPKMPSLPLFVMFGILATAASAPARPPVRRERLPASLSLEFPQAMPVGRFTFTLCLRNRSDRPIPVDDLLSLGQTVQFELRGADRKPLHLARPSVCSPLREAEGAECDLAGGATRSRNYRWLNHFGLPHEDKPTVVYLRARYRSRDYDNPGVVREHFISPSKWYRLEFTGEGVITPPQAAFHAR